MSPEPPYPIAAEHSTKIAVLESKLDGLRDDLSAHSEHVTEALHGLRDQIIKQNGRVRRMEVWKDRMQGAMAVLTIAMPVVTGFVVHYLTQ